MAPAYERAHDIYLTPEFAQRVAGVARAAETDPAAERTFVEIARLVRGLSTGSENGHHPLTDKHARGEGDLRDCTVSEFGFDPGAKRGDFRVLWRQLPPQHGGELPIR